MPAYKAIVDMAFCRGILIVAACNNRDFRIPDYPAYFPTVISTYFAKLSDPFCLERQEGEFGAESIRRHALQFDRSVFRSRLEAALLPATEAAPGRRATA